MLVLEAGERKKAPHRGAGRAVWIRSSGVCKNRAAQAKGILVERAPAGAGYHENQTAEAL